MSEEKKLTPWMIQFYDIKKDYPDSILFFRMGDFYEMFDEDAHIAHKVLGINITSRNKNAETPIPLAWIPYHAKEKYLPILVKAGYKVAIAEQVSDPKAKWIVKREVVRVVTPSTLDLEFDSENNVSSNYILSLVEEKGKYWISFLDFSTNSWKAGSFENIDNLTKEIYKIFPREVILEKKLFNQEELKNILSKKFSLNIYYFENSKKYYEKLISHFNTKNLNWFWVETDKLAQKAASQLLEYLEENQKSSLSFLKDLSYETFSNYMDLDEGTIRNLDLIYNIFTKTSVKWTLFWVLNETKTVMWARFLRENILKPSQNIEEIKKRQNFVEEILKNPILMDKLQKKLSFISDIDTIMNRVMLERASPKDLLNLKKSLQAFLDIYELIELDWSDKLKEILG